MRGAPIATGFLDRLRRWPALTLTLSQRERELWDRLLAATLLFWCIACYTTCAEDSSPRSPLRWAADAEGGAPYIFQDPNNPQQVIGFEVDLAKALAEKLGRPVEWVQYDYMSLVAGLQRGDFDFAMNGLEVTPDRAKVVRFSRPYYVYTLQLVVRANETRFSNLDELLALGGTVGTLEETAAQRLLEGMGFQPKLYGNQTEPYLDLELGRIDAVLMDLPIAVYFAKPNPKLKFLGEPLGEGYYAIAFRPEDEELAVAVDQALTELIAEGQIRAIYEKWGLWNTAQEKLLQAEIIDVIAQARQKWTLRRYFPLLLRGAWVTTYLSVLSMLLAMILGLPIALARLFGSLPIRWLAVGYVEFFRGIPILLLLFFLYYGLPTIADQYGLPFTFRLSPITAAILGFGLNYAAYEAEIYRAGIRSIPSGQWEAAASLGMGRVLTFRRIILPQAIRVILPPMTNDFIALFKDTSIVSIVAVVELTKQYQILAKSSLKYLEIGLVTALLYLILSVPLGALSRHLEARWGKGQ
ncbi:MAG TPA: ABC transporter substrate-binding protein/permease [Thermogutta sp.]|nr:ABC transporter substrate-binding protein/permease [Thermogutta sp.]